MIKVDSIGQEYCLPCADTLEVDGVIVEREGDCLKCVGEGEKMNRYLITLEVDEKWLEVIKRITADVYEGEVCTWLSTNEVAGDAHA